MIENPQQAVGILKQDQKLNPRNTKKLNHYGLKVHKLFKTTESRYAFKQKKENHLLICAE